MRMIPVRLDFSCAKKTSVRLTPIETAAEDVVVGFLPKGPFVSSARTVLCPYVHWSWTGQ